MAETGEAEKWLSRDSGIKGLSILSHFSSLSFPHSFPYDFMHLIWENLIKNLILLWTGEFKGLDEGSGKYQLEPKVYQAVGAACALASSTVPGSYGPRPENISLPGVYLTADAHSFWALYLGPVLLECRFKKVKYYDHFCCRTKVHADTRGGLT
jgi:hypothetical protein